VAGIAAAKNARSERKPVRAPSLRKGLMSETQYGQNDARDRGDRLGYANQVLQSPRSPSRTGLGYEQGMEITERPTDTLLTITPTAAAKIREFMRRGPTATRWCCASRSRAAAAGLPVRSRLRHPWKATTSRAVGVNVVTLQRPVPRVPRSTPDRPPGVRVQDRQPLVPRATPSGGRGRRGRGRGAGGWLRARTGPPPSRSAGLVVLRRTCSRAVRHFLVRLRSVT
jgi:hypothetical protein